MVLMFSELVQKNSTSDNNSFSWLSEIVIQKTNTDKFIIKSLFQGSYVQLWIM